MTRFDVVAINPHVEPFAPSEPEKPATPEADELAIGDAFEPEADRPPTAAPRFDLADFADASRNGPYGLGSDRA